MKSCIDKTAMALAVIMCVVCAVICLPNIKRPDRINPPTHIVERVALADMDTLTMQKELNRLGHNLKEDGIFGPKTHAALQKEINKKK